MIEFKYRLTCDQCGGSYMLMMCKEDGYDTCICEDCYEKLTDTDRDIEEDDE